MRVAAIDCGTNSIRLLVADVEAGVLRDVVRGLRIVRLGQGVDRTGRFDPEALTRTLDAVAEYGRMCVEHGVTRLRFVATSATRDAADRDVFTAAVAHSLGVKPEVVSGAEEAALSFTGATRGLPGVDPDRPVLVVDIGGGSTEAALGVTGGVIASHSVDVGCVRLHERHGADLTGVRRDARAAVDAIASAVPLARATALVGLAGTVTTVAAHALTLDSYRAEAIHGSHLPVSDLVAACDDLAAAAPDALAALPYLHPGRRDVIAAGAVIWRAVLERLAAEAGLTEAVASEHDILDGIAWSLAEARTG